RVPQSRHRVERALVAPPPAALPRLLSRVAHPPLAGQRCAGPAGCATASLRHDRRSPTRRRFASPLRTSRRLTVAHGANLPDRAPSWTGRCAFTRSRSYAETAYLPFDVLELRVGDSGNTPSEARRGADRVSGRDSRPRRMRACPTSWRISQDSFIATAR